MKISNLRLLFSRMLQSMFLLVAVATTPLSAQRIVVTEPRALPVVVESVGINTEITGRIAVTSFDLVFRNPNNRLLEGTFEFPLLEGQNVVGLSLDINGKQRDAVPVEKDRGRIVFEEIMRRRVDPALLEKTAGNNYRLRIYPIPANGTRRVIITYQEDLAAPNKTPTYRLALNFPAPLETFSFSVNVQSAGTAVAKARTTLPLILPSWRESKYLDLHQSRFKACGIVEIELPLLTQSQVITERRGESEYFYAELPVASIQPLMRPVPQVVGLLWDASGSGRKRDHAREMALLDAWFGEVKNVEVKLQLFRDRAATPQQFTIKNGDWSLLRTELTKVIYDGATSYDGLIDDSTVGEWLMFSDGLVNYGVNRSAGSLPLRAPVHTILASAQANPAFLRGLAQRHGGEFENLLTTNPAAAARVLRTASLRVLNIDYDPEQIAQVFPEINSPVGDSPLIVSGILHARSSTIRLLIGHNTADAREIELAVHTRVNPSRLAARAWAASKISSLEADLALNRDDIRSTSQEFCIVTADTSLIVLETLQDYLRYDITPPEELRAAWDASHRTANSTGWKGGYVKLDTIANLFAAKLRWWDPLYPVERLPLPTEPVPVVSSSPSTASEPIPQIRVPDGGDLGQNPTTTSQLPESFGEEVVVLSPFVVEAPEDVGYMATSTLAGTRMRTELRDIASSISVTTNQSLNDTGSTNSGNFSYGSSSEVAEEEDAADDKIEEQANPATIALRRWVAHAGYLNRLHRAAPGKQYSIYLEERPSHLLQPGFFLDVAEFFFEAKDPELALRVLSNLAELQLDDPALLRVLAHRLVQAGHPELAVPLFERVFVMRPEEPQSRRDLALACSAIRQYQRAVDLLWEVVTQTWDGRFPNIEVIALNELNAIVATCGQPLDLSKIDSRFLQNLPVGLRVVLSWDTDACDIDLWVDDPTGERAMFNHSRTKQGGCLSSDFTAGYGPEEFLLRNPKPGKYTVRINYYGDNRQTAFGPVTAQIRIFTGFGTTSQKEELLTVRLNERKENLVVGEIMINP